MNEQSGKTPDETSGTPALKGANSFRRNALGRGLSALMTATTVSVTPKKEVSVPQAERWQAPDSEKAEDTADAPLRYLRIDEIVPAASQPRRNFEQDELEELASSIKESGLIQPIIVRRRADGSASAFEIVAGERRWRASKIAGLETVPAVVRELSDKEAFTLGVIENVQREDLNAIEEAAAYKRLIDEYGETQSSLADAIGKDRASIANTLRLLNLPEDLQQLVSSGSLSAGHGRALLTLADPSKQRELAKRIMDEGLSVRAAEHFASAETADRVQRKKPRKQASGKTPALQQVEERLRRALGTKVLVTMSETGTGEIRISFFSEGELESVLERLKA